MRRAFQIAGWTIGSLLALLLVLVGVLMIVGNTDSGRRLIERTAASLTDGHVTLAGLDGSFPSHLQLARLQLSDEHGPWLSAERISLQWSPLSLLTRHVRIDQLDIDQLAIARAPISKPDQKKAATPSIPHVDLSHLVIHTLQLGPELAGSDVSLVVTADAHLRSLQDASAHVSAKRTNGMGDYQLTLQFDAQRMDAQLQLREPANGPLENIVKLPGLGALSVLATLKGPRNAEVIDVTLDAGALHGQVQGTVDLHAQSAELTYALNAPAMTPAPGLAWQKISLLGNWHGPVSAPDASGRLEMAGLQVPGGTRFGTLVADLKAASGLLSTHAVLEQLVIAGPNPDLLRDSPVSLAASIQMNDPKRPLQLTATHRLFALRATAQTAGEQNATLQLTLPNLRPLGALGQQDVKGSAAIKADVTIDGKAIKFVADGDTRIDGGAASWVELLHGNAHLKATGEINDRAYAIDKLTVDGDAVSASASGSIARNAEQSISARVNVMLSDLKRLSSGAAGTLRLTAKADGPLNDFSVAADISSKLSVSGSPPGSLTGSINAQGLPHAPRGTVALQGELDGSPLHVNASVEQNKAKNTFHAIIQHAQWKSAHAEGDLSGSDDWTRAQGQVSFHMTQLGDLDKLLGATLQGSVDGTITLTPDGQQTRTVLHLDAKDVGSGKLRGSAQLTGTGSLDALNLAINAQVPAVAGKPASIVATSVLNLDAHTFRIDTARISLQEQQLTLAAPATLSFADGLAITATTLKSQGATLQIEGRVTPALNLKAALHNVTPALINTVFPNLVAAGKIDGDATVSGSLSQPTGVVHVQAIGMRSGNGITDGLPAVDVHVDAQLQGDTATVDAKLAAGAKSQVTLNGNAPLSQTGNFDLKLAGQLSASILNPLLEAHGRHVEGQFTLDTTIHGTATDPQIQGSINLAQGTFRDYTQGINLTAITAEIQGTQKQLHIVSLKARASSGTVSATGTINILDPGIPVDIKVTADNARPITSDIVTASVDSDIHITGKARKELNVEGTVHVNRANIGIPSSFPPDVAVLDVRRPGDAAAAQQDKPLIIHLDVQVQAPRQILVRGRGLDAELGGDLRIRGTTDAPRVSGAFDLQRGTFDIANSRLNFSSGSVTFNGAGLKGKLDPTLDFTAQTSLSDGTATVRISGFADSPQVTLSSTPDMPQDEILARLLFGQPAAQLTALQVVQIGAALAKLGGGNNSLNPLTAIQKTLGLDRLSVSGGSTGNSAAGDQDSGATVEAGKYVSSRVFVSVKESTTGSSQLAVSVDLTKHLKLQTRLGNGTATAQGTTPENDPGSSVGIAYTFEY